MLTAWTKCQFAWTFKCMYTYVYKYIDRKICSVNHLTFCFDFSLRFMFKPIRRRIKRGCTSIYWELDNGKQRLNYMCINEEHTCSYFFNTYENTNMTKINFFFIIFILSLKRKISCACKIIRLRTLH